MTDPNPTSASPLPPYVLVTPARDEARFIESTIRSVIAQTIHPLKWVIVSDGSTDGTDEIVQRYAAENPWIELHRMPERRERHFAGKALAVRAAVERLQDLPYDVIVSLDADIALQPDHFEYLLGKLQTDPLLGVIGTPYRDATDETYDYRFVSTTHVSGACQMFRRACFEEIGGYVLSKGGAIDTIATLTARSKGWKTRTFTDRIGLHQRVIGTAMNGPLKSRFILGKRDWAVGNHPVWELCRGLYQMTRRPLLLRGMAILAGYAWAAFSGAPRPVPRELRAIRRKEQMAHLGRFLRRARPETGSENATRPERSPRTAG